jgi:hypothetical protein
MHRICSFFHLHFGWVVLQLIWPNKCFQLESKCFRSSKTICYGRQCESIHNLHLVHTWNLEEPKLYYSYYKSQQVCFHLVSEKKCPTRCPLRRSIIHINALLELLYNTTIRYVFSPTNEGFIGALFHSCILPYE